MRGNYTAEVAALTMYATGRGALPANASTLEVARYEDSNFSASGLYGDKSVQRIALTDFDNP